ncbi:hypothetical protein O6H91_17G056900 [Diphasiastrum complanatum]|uniref:Uncharacterized protein n=1 Tax=Diphasiastrum complanatum TaxID=34168 RepID=A0ACC2B879_DIPCM|nr:hypothetical protein O6H91_17G056900 [Diphasiastrum complanatum]
MASMASMAHSIHAGVSFQIPMSKRTRQYSYSHAAFVELFKGATFGHLFHAKNLFISSSSAILRRGARPRKGSGPRHCKFFFRPPACTVEHRQQIIEVRKYAPFLESAFLQSHGFHLSAEWKAIPDIWRTAAEKFGDRVALVDPHHDPFSQISYNELEQEILNFSEGLRVLGTCPNEKVALYADNSCRWLVADQGIMAVGAADVVRGSRSSTEELIYIFDHSESVALVVDNPELYSRFASKLNASLDLKYVVLLWGEKSSLRGGGSEGESMDKVPIYTFEELLALGRKSRISIGARNSSITKLKFETIHPDDIATIVYTSGTTGNPKGVVLTHSNILHQVLHLISVVQPEPGDRFLSVLPPWHMYERAAEYFTLTLGVEQVYTNVKNLKEDLKQYPPTYLIAVPLIFDTLYRGAMRQISATSKARRTLALALISISLKLMEYKRIYQGRALSKSRNPHNEVAAAIEWIFSWFMATILLPFHLLGEKLVFSKIRAAFGISKAAISGGGSLPPHVDRFFEAIGVTLLNGYGLTETSPVISARIAANNVLGTVGKPLKYTEVKVVDAKSGTDLEPGSKGLVKVRGPQVMREYFRNPVATNKAIDNEGWFDTGDLGWVAPETKGGPARMCGGTIVLDGRAKDTIVLSTGENVEPAEIEETALQSRFIDQIMLVGQDQRRIGALVVLNRDELHSILPSLHQETSKSLDEIMEVKALVRAELNKFGTDCSFQIGPFLLLDEPFTIGSGLLTPTMKLRRDAILSIYKDKIDALFIRASP